MAIKNVFLTRDREDKNILRLFFKSKLVVFPGQSVSMTCERLYSQHLPNEPLKLIYPAPLRI